MRDCENCKNHTDKGCTKWECEFEPTTKNDLGVDCISRQAVIDLMMQKWGENFSGDDAMQESIDAIREMPSVTPQEPISYQWCTDCKEYDQEKHCCHRWSKVIRDTVEEMKQEQEPKPMVEIDLYSVIKQKYIEREVLDKIRAEIEAYTDPQGFITISEGRFNSILDKYKAETEAEDEND